MSQGDLDRLFPIGGREVALLTLDGAVHDPEPDLRFRLALRRVGHSRSQHSIR